jgi:hypothetical protein
MTPYTQLCHIVLVAGLIQSTTGFGRVSRPCLGLMYNLKARVGRLEPFGDTALSTTTRLHGAISQKAIILKFN